MANQVVFGHEGRDAILVGMAIVTNAVKSTLWPKGRNVIIQKSFGSPLITNDGVTVAKAIDLEDNFEKMGAEIIKEVASKTNEGAGDGTSTATVLAEAIIKEGLKNVSSGTNPIMIRTGLKKAVEKAVSELKRLSKTIATNEEIAQVATVAAQDAEVGKIIATGMEKVGKNGTITVEEWQTMGLDLQVVQGMELEHGFLSPYMMTDSEAQKAEFVDVPILITDSKISVIKDLLPLLEALSNAGKKDLVIIAENVEGEALTTLVINKLRGIFNCLVIKAPGFGDRRKEMLNDIAILTGGTLITKELGLSLETTTIEQLGSATKITASKDSSIIVGGKGDKVAIGNRVRELQQQLENSKSEYDKEKLQERVAKLAGGVAVIKVGASTEVELKEKKLRIEDALNATKAAVEEGVIAGGGTVFIKIMKVLRSLKGRTTEEQIGIDIIKRALKYPLFYIAENAGNSGEVIVEKIANEGENIGYNALTGKVVNMIEAGIIDPTKVARLALENALSAASTFLTTEVVISDIKEKEESMPAGGGMPGGMGWMGGMPMM